MAESWENKCHKWQQEARARGDPFLAFVTKNGLLNNNGSEYMILNGTVLSGWLPILQELVEKLTAVGWDRRVSCIKEKFGGLRFYTDILSDTMSDMIDEATQKCSTTCEQCGSPGTLREDYWMRTMCDACNELYLARLNQNVGQI